MTAPVLNLSPLADDEWLALLAANPSLQRLHDWSANTTSTPGVVDDCGPGVTKPRKAAAK
jgi:hypothetical protein